VHHLDRDVLAQLAVVRPVDRAHAPGPECAHDLVAAGEDLSRLEHAGAGAGFLRGRGPRRRDLAAQLVELAVQPRLARLDAGGHAVEHARQPAQLVGATGHVGQRARLVAARLHRARGADHALDFLQVGQLAVAQPLLLQARADARLEEHGLEGLRQVVLGAALDAAHHAGQVVERGDHDHGHVARARVGLDALEHGEAVELRHHHVEQDEVERRRREHLEGAAAARRALDGVALPLQPALQDGAVVLDVVHDEDAGGCRGRRGGAGRRRPDGRGRTGCRV